MFTTDSQSFANLSSIVVAHSEADDFAAACAEWDVTGLEVIDPKADEGGTPGRCVCGHYPILDCYAIRNRLNGSTLYPVGNVCIRHFDRADMTDDADGLLAVARVREQSARLAPCRSSPARRARASGRSRAARSTPCTASARSTPATATTLRGTPPRPPTTWSTPRSTCASRATVSSRSPTRSSRGELARSSSSTPKSWRSRPQASGRLPSTPSAETRRKEER